MAEHDSDPDVATDERLRREGLAWRDRRAGCPPPDLLMAHGSEALPDQVRARLERHLRSCDACGRFARDFDALELELPPDVERRVLQHVRPPGVFGPGRILMLAASLLMASGLVASWWVRSRTLGGPGTTTSRAGGRAPAAPAVTAPSHQPALWAIAPATVRLPLSSLGVTRGARDAGRQTGDLLSALEPYEKANYPLAITRLEAFVRQYPTVPDGFLYLGVSCLMAGRPLDSLAPLEQAAVLQPLSKRREIDWYLAAAEQRSGRPAESRTRLRRLCAVPGAYQASACAAEATLK